MCAKVMKKKVLLLIFINLFSLYAKKVGIANNLQPPLSLFLWSVPYSSMPFRCMTNIELTLCQPIDSSV